MGSCLMLMGRVQIKNPTTIRGRVRREKGVDGLSLSGAHEENGLAQAAPRVVQFREEHVGRGDAAVVRGRRSDRDEVGRGAHLHWWGVGEMSSACGAERLVRHLVKMTTHKSFTGGKTERNRVSCSVRCLEAC